VIPILFEDTSDFTSKGIGELTDAVSCIVDMKDLQYDLKLVYPVDGEYYSELRNRRIIYAKPNQVDVAQPFYIYRVGKTIKGTTSFYAHHISYDLSGIPVKPFTATSATDFAQKLKANAATACAFTFETDLDVTEIVEIESPTSLRSLLGGSENTWQDVYGGEFKFDHNSVKLLRSAGADRGVVLRYGVDITDFQQDENISEMNTGVWPFYQYREDETVTEVWGDVQHAEGNFDFERILPVDITEFVGTTPTKAQVNELGRRWMQDNEIGKPIVSMTLSYAQLDQIVRLHDTVSVEFVKIGVSEKAQITKTSFDVLRERYVSIDVGDIRSSLSDEIHDASKLRKGLLPVERIKDNSIDGDKKLRGGSVGGGGGGALKKNSITDAELKDNCVTVNKIVDGAVISAKIADGSVTGNKVLDQAIAYAKLSGEMQLQWTNILAANRIYAGVINADGSISCPYLVLGGHQMRAGTIRYTNSVGVAASMLVAQGVSG